MTPQHTVVVPEGSVDEASRMFSERLSIRMRAQAHILLILSILRNGMTDWQLTSLGPGLCVIPTWLVRLSEPVTGPVEHPCSDSVPGDILVSLP